MIRRVSAPVWILTYAVLLLTAAFGIGALAGESFKNDIRVRQDSLELALKGVRDLQAHQDSVQVRQDSTEARQQRIAVQQARLAEDVDKATSDMLFMMDSELQAFRVKMNLKTQAEIQAYRDAVRKAMDQQARAFEYRMQEEGR